MTRLCPCGTEIVPASGSKDADILLIGEFPGEEEIERGRPFVGPSGKVLRKEMARTGLDMIQCRVTNLWMHQKNGDERCFKIGLEQALEEAKGKKAILLIGSECAYTFLNMKMSDVCGLKVESAMLSAPLVMAMINPAIVFQPNKGIGEIRLATQKFAKNCADMGLIKKDDLDDD